LANEDFPLQLVVTRLIEVPCSGTPKPYKTHMPSPGDKEQEYRLEFNIRYSRIEALYEAMQKLYEAFKKTNQFHYEIELEEMLTEFTQ